MSCVYSTLARACAHGGNVRVSKNHKRVNPVPKLVKASATARLKGGEVDGKGRIWPVLSSTR